MNPSDKKNENSREMVNFEYVISESPFKGVSKDKVDELFSKIGQKYVEEYQKDLNGLKKLLEDLNILDVLSWFSVYCLTAPLDQVPNISADKLIIQYQVEILQALFLQNNKIKLDTPFSSFHMDEIIELINKVPEAFINKRIVDVENYGDNEKEAFMNLEMFRANTMTIRNWGHREQVIRLTKELFTPIDDLIKKEYKISTISLIKMLESVLDTVELKLNERNQLIHDIYNSSDISQMIKLFQEHYPSINKKELHAIKNKFKSKEEFALYLILDFSNQFLKEIYTIKLSEFVKAYPEEINEDILNNVIRNWSFTVGDLSDFPTEHIFLGNPIWKKPLLIVDENTYCWPITGIFVSFCVELIENIFIDNQRLKKIYERRRAQFLEKSIEKLFKRNFESAEIYSNLMRDEGETDLLVLIDSYAIIVEAKSGKISDSAKRGSFKRFQREIKKLIVKPSKQAIEFAEYIENNKNKVEFTNKNKEKICVDLSKIKNILTLSVTFDLFAYLASKIPSLSKIGFIEDNAIFTPNMSLADLEIFFDLLETDSEKIHYLIKRYSLEKERDYMADELDLLAFYLQTGFNFGDTDFNNVFIQLYGVSEEILDSYLITKHLEEQNPKPLPRRTKWWQDIIGRIDDLKPLRGIEVSLSLLNVSFEDQKAFEMKVKEVKNIVDKEWKQKNHTNYVSFYNKPAEELIIGYCYNNISTSERDKRISLISRKEMEKFGLTKATVIGIDVYNKIYPYGTLGISFI